LGKSALAALAVGAVLAGLVAGADPRARFWSGAGVLYAGALMASPVLLRASPAYGLPAILWLYAVVWTTDVMAYFGGRLIGGPKLWPRVSPGKTWSGALVGAASGALCGALVGVLGAPSRVPLVPFLILGLAASIVAQLGDLFESAVKRRFGAKDSSHLIPGHGGMMDRLDGFVAAAAFAALVGWLRSSGDWIASGLFQW
jgi:phosphatidate cytidylyltransferase